MQKFVKIMAVVLLTMLSASLAAAPVAYSINSDSGSNNADSLHLIDLATGTETLIGRVQIPFVNQVKLDVEGLAFAPDGTLYGIDDDSMTIFPIDINTGQVQTSSEAFISSLPFGGGNDFGMTFACDDKLYLTSIAKGSLYSLDLDGTPSLIGPLGEKINALAAFGNPVKLYGLGNGMDGNGNQDSPNLYEIDPATGAASKVGTGLGAAAVKYAEGGLAFDDAGQLWAILDSHEPLLPSPGQILKIDTVTGLASEAKFVSEVGYESLAIAVPGGCSGENDVKSAVSFKVTQHWLAVSADAEIEDTTVNDLYCSNVVDGDGRDKNGTMYWSWTFNGEGDSHTAKIIPQSDGTTSCQVKSRTMHSAVETGIECATGPNVQPDDGPHECTVTSVVFEEGIPTLNFYGLLIFSLLMLSSGMLAVRRF
jgi:hypothetical protein